MQYYVIIYNSHLEKFFRIYAKLAVKYREVHYHSAKEEEDEAMENYDVSGGRASVGGNGGICL